MNDGPSEVLALLRTGRIEDLFTRRRSNGTSNSWFTNAVTLTIHPRRPYIFAGRASSGYARSNTTLISVDVAVNPRVASVFYATRRRPEDPLGP